MSYISIQKENLQQNDLDETIVQQIGFGLQAKRFIDQKKKRSETKKLQCKACAKSEVISNIFNSKNEYTKPSDPADIFGDSDTDDELMEDEQQMEISKGAWEKFDYIETHVDAHSKYNVGCDKTCHDTKHYFGEQDTYELLLNFPELEMLKYRQHDSNLQYSLNMKGRKRRWSDLKDNKDLWEFNNSMDEFTFNLINKLIVGNFITKVDQIVSYQNREAIIFHAESNENYRRRAENVPRELTIKIFKKKLQMRRPPPEYYYNPRASIWNAPVITDIPRRKLNTLARKEMELLKKLDNAGILCPKPMLRTKHVIVTSFIGKNNQPAGKFKNVTLDCEDYVITYNEVINALKVMFQKVNIVNIDFMEKILWFGKHCYFVDFSAAKDITDDGVSDLLLDECKAVTDFFKEKEIPGVLETSELFHFVTGA